MSGSCGIGNLKQLSQYSVMVLIKVKWSLNEVVVN